MLTNTEDTSIFDAGNNKRYRFLGKLGSGGMAEVFLGIRRWEKDFSSLVAIKRLYRNAVTDKAADPLRLFTDEAKVIAALSHPHIVKVGDLLVQNDDILIVMEYVNGETFRTIMSEVVKQRQHIPLPIICRWIMDAAEALHYAHNATSLDGEPLRLVHRDIDMRNLMVDENGYLKIIDFGVSQTITRQSARTGDHTFMGKVSYAAPELFTAPETADHRTDLYALGLVFHALVTQRKPYPARKASATTDRVHQVITESLLKPSSLNPKLPPAIDALIAQATHKEPNRRFQTGESFADAVATFANSHGGLATPQEVKRWYHARFSSRIAMRQRFVHEAMARAETFIRSEALHDEDPRRDSMTPSLIFQVAPQNDGEDPNFEDTEAYDEKATAVMSYAHPKSPRRHRWAMVAGVFVLLTVSMGVGWIASGYQNAGATADTSAAAPSGPTALPAGVASIEAATGAKRPADRKRDRPPVPEARAIAEAPSSGSRATASPAVKTSWAPKARTRRMHRPDERRASKPQARMPLTRVPDDPRDAAESQVRVFSAYDDQDTSFTVADRAAHRDKPAKKKIRLLESYD